MEAIRAVVLSAVREGCIKQVKGLGLEETDMTWGLVLTLHQNSPTYLVRQLRKCKLAKVTRFALQKQRGKTNLVEM